MPRGGHRPGTGGARPGAGRPINSQAKWLTVPRDPERAAAVLRRRFTLEEVQRLIKALLCETH
jgi:hypothetical protein